jgi:hypothetical protein
MEPKELDGQSLKREYYFIEGTVSLLHDSFRIKNFYADSLD